MCLQDFQMMRRTSSTKTGHNTATVDLPANPMRLRLIVAVFSGIVSVRFGGANANKSVAAIGTVIADPVDANFYAATEVLRIEDYGSMLLEDVSVVAVSGAPIFYVSEVIALPDLDRLINGGK